MDIKKQYQKWCRETDRGGGVLIGKSIIELLVWWEKQKIDKVAADTKSDLYYANLTKKY